MIPLFTSKQVREADKYAIEELKIPSVVLMENAAISITEIVRDYFPEIDQFNQIGIVCGKGNNGGDGFAIARHFINSGFTIKVLSIPTEEEMKGDAKVNFQILKNLKNKIDLLNIKFFKKSADTKWLADCTLIIDAILGTGTKGELKAPYDKIVDGLNKLEAFKVAVDIPTGLDVDSAYGSTIFEADLTITLAELKSGLFYGKGYTFAGEVKKGSIGMGPEYFNQLEVDEYLIEPEDAYFNLPPKELDAHKYSSGKVLVIAGSGFLPGASILASNSALNSGAGAVILAFPKSIKSFAQSQLDSVVLYPYEDEGNEYLSEANIDELEEKIRWADSIILGPGLGREKTTQNAVLKLLKDYSNKNIVLDADALFVLNNTESSKLNLNGKVLTPHHGEFANMLGIKTEELQKDLMKYGRKFANDTGAYLVLKGAPTIIFTPGGEALINTVGNPGMAKFGTGDVLSGIIGSFIAQSKDIDKSLISAVYIHSLSADLLLNKKTIYGITAPDISSNLPEAIKFLHETILQSN